MAIFHLNMSVIRRCGPSNGAGERARRKASWQKGGTEKDRSAVGASAYRAGARLHDSHDGRTHDYTARKGVFGTEVLLPPTAPSWMSDRGALWNAVELAERRYDARVAREVNMALPVELSDEARMRLVRAFVGKEVVGRGMAADVAFHDFQGRNPHAHVLMSIRQITPDGFGNRLRELDTWGRGEATLVAHLRSAWCEACNAALAEAGEAARIDHRSLVAQGRAQLATIHLGPKWTALNRTNPGTPMPERDKRSQAVDAVTKLNAIRDQAWLSAPNAAAAARSATEHYGRLREAWYRQYGRAGVRLERLGALAAAGELGQKPADALRRSPAYLRRRRIYDEAQLAPSFAKKRLNEAVSNNGGVDGVLAQAYADAIAYATAVKQAWVRWLASQRARWARLLRLQADVLETGRPVLAEKAEIDRHLDRWGQKLQSDGSVSRVVRRKEAADRPMKPGGPAAGDVRR